MKFRLSPDIDVKALAAAFAQEGRVRIAPFLEKEVAQALFDHLRAREDWRQIINSGNKLFELDRPARAGMTSEQLHTLDQAVFNGARRGFQHRYEAIRLPDGNLTEEISGLDLFPRWMSAGDVRELLRAVTGMHDVDFADGQATAYAPGDFLTAHDDAVKGKRRRAAYVLGLTPEWRADWGGMLLFHGPAQAVAGHAPGFNTLDLFAVPQPHSVSLVTPSAPFRRYAVTGWLRDAGNTGAI